MITNWLQGGRACSPNLSLTDIGCWCHFHNHGGFPGRNFTKDSVRNGKNFSLRKIADVTMLASQQPEALGFSMARGMQTAAVNLSIEERAWS
jgi:hypothetical protein